MTRVSKSGDRVERPITWEVELRGWEAELSSDSRRLSQEAELPSDLGRLSGDFGGRAESGKSRDRVESSISGHRAK